MAEKTSAKLHTLVGRYSRYPAKVSGRKGEGGSRVESSTVRSTLNRPFVTIITVSFNAAQTIERTIKSVHEQTYDNLEHIIIDGASSDGTLNIVKECENHLAYYISEPDDGLYHAMNKGLELAQGAYILFLNADDWYEPDAVESLVNACEQSQCDFSGALARYINSDGSNHILRTMPFDQGTMLRMPLRHETLLIPAELYDRIGPYDTSYPIISDFDYAIRLFRAGATYYEVPRPLLNFSTGGVSNTERDRLFAETRVLMSDIFPFLSDTELTILTTPETLGSEALTKIANRHGNHADFVQASRAVLSDRRVHGGKLWKAGDLLSVAPKKQPYISVIMPLYNARDTIDAALDSVLEQEFANLEIVCVDDCSSDSTIDHVLSRSKTDPRIKLIRNAHNLGPGASRNAGIRAARGAYVFFLDADDSLPAGALDALFVAARQSKSQIVRGAFRALQNVHGKAGRGAVKHPLGKAPDANLVTNLTENPALLKTTEGHWASLYEAAFVRTVLYAEDVHVGEDSVFLVKAHTLARSITVIRDVVYNYKANSDSTMNRLTPSKYFDGLTWRRRAFYILRDAGLPEIGTALLLNFWSLPYFSGLEETLSEDQCNRFFAQLSKTIHETGTKELDGVHDLKLRAYLDKRLQIRKPANQKDWANLGPDAPSGLRIATLTTQDHGGAGIGSQRRVEALRRHGADARIFCSFKKTEKKYVNKLPYARPIEPDAPHEIAWNAWLNAAVLTKKEHPELKARELFSKTDSIVDFHDIKSIFDAAEIIHMHWVSGILDLDNTDVLAAKPVTWTLADMNAFTGGCHYSEGCEGYKQECKNCPLLGEGSDVAHKAWKRKRNAYAKIPNLHVICPSQWLADCASASSLLGNRPVHMIPNALPTNRFKLTNKLVARSRLGLPLQKKLIAFGAESLSNSRKGGDILAKAMVELKQAGRLKGVEGVFFGNADLDVGVPVHAMGHVSDEEQLSLIYAAADIFAFPSREDNAPLTVAEAMLSGTPVVGFPVGNVPELVTHKETGYIARMGDISDFANGLSWLLESSQTSTALMRSLKAHLKAAEHNDPSKAIARHMQVYDSLVNPARQVRNTI